MSADDNSQALIKQLQLPGNFDDVVRNIYLPLAKIIIEKASARTSSGPALISINGIQGSGKSTIVCFLKKIIQSELSCDVAVLSLDDFYLSRKHRITLSTKVHPLLKTRGVPGTHDVGILEQVLESLLNKQPCISPRFDKARDDRCDRSLWQVHEEPVDIILFEGWCNNSPAQSEHELKHAINELEKIDDTHGIWRHFVNDQLIDYHRRLFNLADMTIMLKADRFESVYKWRGLQEKKLKTVRPGANGSRTMNEKKLKWFIQHFERISRHSLQYLPESADVVIAVAEDHSVTKIKQK